MLRSAVITVRLTEAPSLDRRAAERTFLGRSAQAILLELAAAVDPTLAAWLHEGDGPRPYAVGAALRPPFGGDEPWRVRLRFSALGARLAESLPAMLAHLPETLRVDQWSGAVESISTGAESDAGAGSDSFQEILNRRLLPAEAPDPRVSFRFVTPTTFHSGGRNQPLPLPGLVFGSLVDRWNAFSPLTLNAEARRYAEECLVVSQFRLESQVVDLSGGKQIGAVGTVTFRSIHPDPYWLRVVAALADFAFFAGVGAKTTMGLGQTRRVDGRLVGRGAVQRAEDRPSG